MLPGYLENRPEDRKQTPETAMILLPSRPELDCLGVQEINRKETKMEDLFWNVIQFIGGALSTMSELFIGMWSFLLQV